MKSIIALIFSVTAVLCAVNATVAPNGVNIDNLQKDLLDFKKVIPMDKMHAIIEKHLFYDREFQKSLAFLKSKEFDEVLAQITKSKEFRDLYNYLDKEGWFVHPLSFSDDDSESDESESAEEKFQRRISPRNAMDLLDELIAALPKHDVTELIKEKVATSPDFRAFYETLTSEELQALMDAILNSPENQSQWEILKQHGIDVKTVDKKLRAVLLWGKY